MIVAVNTHKFVFFSQNIRYQTRFNFLLLKYHFQVLPTSHHLVYCRVEDSIKISNVFLNRTDKSSKQDVFIKLIPCNNEGTQISFNYNLPLHEFAVSTLQLLRSTYVYASDNLFQRS